jgi:hypothetical protein
MKSAGKEGGEGVWKAARRGREKAAKFEKILK